MARRKSKKEKELESLFYLIFIVPAFLIYFATQSIQSTVSIMIVYWVVAIAFLIIRNKKLKERLRASGINEIDKMDGIKFEHYLKELYSTLGYNAKVTPSSGDFGADLILTQNARKIVVQAKRHSNNVGVKAVQEIKAAQSHYDAGEAWVITNSYFTKAAIELAKSNSVKLINRDQLIQQILDVKKTG
ncbi:restriction endonuclease [Neobacillus sp. YIM B06451]|uniref:restriction endonuclease n=1 Tax=Neobacillus sp. YIM B06451 TaxID=3070994 RepID=UPI00292F6E3A|nr:restriction endonuclease [Neobacillus sp. YIM B06451]